MNSKNNRSIKAITEGGLFTAGYALLAIISRYLLTGTDSLIYYFTPLLLAIYVVRNKIGYSVAVLIASITLSFLFANPLVALMVIMPNIIIGFVFGCVEKYSKIKVINYLVTFALCIAASLLSIYAFELINGIGYWDDTAKIFNEFVQNFNIYNAQLIESIVNISLKILIIVDSLIKTTLIYLVFGLIVKRLKLIPDYSLKIKLPLKFKIVISIIYIVLFLLLVLSLNIYIINLNKLMEIFVVILSTVVFIYSFYLIYQFIIFLRFKFKKINNGIFIIIILFSIIFFPISIIVSLILNLIQYNILLYLI